MLAKLILCILVTTWDLVMGVVTAATIFHLRLMFLHFYLCIYYAHIFIIILAPSSVNAACMVEPNTPENMILSWVIIGCYKSTYDYRRLLL
jgi:predicted membrane protein